MIKAGHCCKALIRNIGGVGCRNQAVGVADALKFDYEIKVLELSTLGRLPNIILGASLIAITNDSKNQILPPWPDLVISAGRRAASIARHIKRKSGGRSFICHIMYPGFSNEIDLIAIPKHDQLKGGNIFNITGAPNRITEEFLAGARATCRDPPWSASCLRQRRQPVVRDRCAGIVWNSVGELA